MIVFKNCRNGSFYDTVSYKLCEYYMLDSIDLEDGVGIIIYPINNNFLKRRGLKNLLNINRNEYVVRNYASRWPKAYTYKQIKGI